MGEYILPFYMNIEMFITSAIDSPSIENISYIEYYNIASYHTCTWFIGVVFQF